MLLYDYSLLDNLYLVGAFMRVDAFLFTTLYR